MLSWFQALMPKEEKFFDHFERHARTLVEGAKTLRSLLEGGDNVSRCCAEIVRLEHEAFVKLGERKRDSDLGKGEDGILGQDFERPCLA